MATAQPSHAVPDTLIRAIGALPRTQVAEVEDFVDFLGGRERRLAEDGAVCSATSAVGAPALAAVWSNPEDDVYDAH